MGFLGDLLTGGASPVGAAVQGALSGLGDTAIKLRSAITGDMAPDKRAELEKHLADIDAKISEAQSAVNAVEAANPSFFVAGWRPAIGWLSACGLTYQFVAFPFFVWFSENYGWKNPPVLDSATLYALVTGMLGLGAARTVEKINGVHNTH